MPWVPKSARTEAEPWLIEERTAIRVAGSLFLQLPPRTLPPWPSRLPFETERFRAAGAGAERASSAPEVRMFALRSFDMHGKGAGHRRDMPEGVRNKKMSQAPMLARTFNNHRSTRVESSPLPSVHLRIQNRQPECRTTVTTHVRPAPACSDSTQRGAAPARRPALKTLPDRKGFRRPNGRKRRLPAPCGRPCERLRCVARTAVMGVGETFVGRARPPFPRAGSEKRHDGRPSVIGRGGIERGVPPLALVPPLGGGVDGLARVPLRLRSAPDRVCTVRTRRQPGGSTAGSSGGRGARRRSAPQPRSARAPALGIADPRFASGHSGGHVRPPDARNHVTTLRNESHGVRGTHAPLKPRAPC